ncbi:MAG: recombinase family protein [Clostridia bacterium]|nr:recombinase family protein [Clostridia bacterium]
MIAIYSRKSKYTGKGESIANQIEMCKQYISLHFGNAKFVIYEDEGFSGKNTDRPQFKAMMLEIDRGNIDKIVCYRLDRISRNMSDFVKLIDLLNEKNVQFISITESFDTTIPMGKAMMYISSIFSQLERETIAERIRDNLMELAKTGRWLGGITPTGYRSVEVESVGISGRTKKAHKLEIIESEADIIRLIYDEFIDIKSLTKLESRLINRDIKTKNNIYFSRFALKSILTNPVYAIADEDSYEYFKPYDIFADRSGFNGTYGVIAYNKTKQSKKRTKVNPVEDWIIAVGGHKGIISGHDWVRVQNILGENSNKSYRKPRVNNALLSGIIYCGCGSRMGPKMGRNGTFSYVCRLKLKSNRGRCRAENINGVKLDNYVVKLIKGFECDNICLIRELEKGKKYIKGSMESNISVLHRKLSNNKNEINSLVSKLADANSSVEKYIIERINALDAENTDIEGKIAEQEKTERADKMTARQIEEFKERVKSFSACVDNMSLEEKRAAIKTLINKIICNNNNIEISFASKDIVSLEWNNMNDTDKGKETWEKLKYWRCKRGYLQREVAEAVGITRAMYMSYEKKNGFCPAENLVKIAEFLGVDFKELAEDYHYFQLADNQCERIQKARKKLGLTKTKFAELMGVNRSTVYKWEKLEGKISRIDYMKIREVAEL